MTPVAASELERFRGLIVRRLGLQFDDSKLGFLGDVLRRRVEAVSDATDVYLAQLESEASSQETAALAQELTVGETYFFRHIEQYRAFTEIALRDRLDRALASGTRLAVLSAGCASGEEPYSLAITIRDAVNAENASIVGVDINPAQIEKARRGRFSPWVLRETPRDLQQRWFRAEGKEFALDNTIRNAVRFEVCNLSDPGSELWRPESHDIVFCRNVLMYFSPASAQAVVSRLARSLKPGGYLFLGHAETLRGLSSDFHLLHTHGTFYYQRRDHLKFTPSAGAAAARDTAARESSAVSALDGTHSWIDAIQRASERIRSLVESSSAAPPAHRRSVSGRPAREVGAALELLRAERFAEALELVTSLPSHSEADPEVLLLRAVLLTHDGQLAAAEGVCERLLQINELNAEAHYLLALCREGRGDQARALYHDQVAIYLDPSFAMAHLHLGLIARRAQDLTTARRELGQAIALLDREDTSRLLLFAGGFSRDALVSLCRGELLRSGGHA